MRTAHRRHLLLVNAVAACVGVGGILVYANVATERAQRAVDLSLAREAAISRFRVSMNRASASMAAYTVSGDEDLAADARSSRAAAEAEANRIRELFADRPSQVGRTRRLDERMAERGEIESTVLDAVRTGGRESGQAALRTGRWMANRLALRAVTEEMLREEESGIVQQEAHLAGIRTLSTWGIVGLVGLLLASFLATVTYTRADESARARAMEEIRASESRYRDLVTLSPAAVFVNRGGRIEFVNQAMLDLVGAERPEQVLGRSPFEFFHPDFHEVVQERIDRLLKGERVPLIDEQLIRLDGTVRHARVAASPLRDAGGIAIQVVLLDVTERLRAEENLRRSEERLDVAARSGSMGLWELDLSTGKAWRTLRHDQIFGYDELQPSWGPEEALRHVVPEDRPIFHRAFDTAMATGQFHYELRIQTGRSPLRWIEARGEVLRDGDGTPTRMAGVVQDVTQRHEMQEHLEVTARLSALGTLVAGLAHEINTPLATEIASEGFALDSLRQMERRLRSGTPVDRDALQREMTEIVGALSDARASGDRIARIVKDLSTIGRKDAPRTRVGLRKVVDRALHWLPAPLSRGAAIRVEEADPPDVVGSEGQLGQVVVNLVTNAAKAIPGERRGNITVRIGKGPAGTSRLEVSDDGSGMTPEVMKRVFDPFFTTRKAGEGMGLGLAISHAIVTAHGGTISVSSEVGRGTTFRVDLPSAPADATT